MSSATSSLSTTSKKKSFVEPVDASFLRRALRLVHCLQRERGASCSALYYHQNTSAHDGVEDEHLQQVRADTDRGLLALERHVKKRAVDRKKVSSLSSTISSIAVLKLTLEKIRILVSSFSSIFAPLSSSPAPSSLLSPPSCHRVLVSFQTLISAVLHETIFRATAVAKRRTSKRHKKAWRSTSSTATSLAWLHTNAAQVGADVPRVVSHPALHKLATNNRTNLDESAAPGPTKRAPKPGHRRRHTAEGWIESSAVPHAPVTAGQYGPVVSSDLKRNYHSFESRAPQRIESGNSCNNVTECRTLLLNGTGVIVLKNAERGTGLCPAPGDDSTLSEELHNDAEEKQLSNEQLPLHITNKHHIEDHQDRLERLLYLLDLLVRLKESTGVERATLTAMLNNHLDYSTDTRLMLNDVVLEIEQQRRQLEELNSLCATINSLSPSSTAESFPLPRTARSVLSATPTSPLRPLLQELIQLSPELLHVQNLVLCSASRDPDKYNEQKKPKSTPTLLHVQNLNFCYTPRNLDSPQEERMIQSSPKPLHENNLVFSIPLTNSSEKEKKKNDSKSTIEHDQGEDNKITHQCGSTSAIPALNVLRQEYDSTQLWNLLTVYIDKLHSFELLIVEEIECCCDDGVNDAATVDDSIAVEYNTSVADAMLTEAQLPKGVDNESTSLLSAQESSLQTTVKALQQIFGLADVGQLFLKIQEMNADQVKDFVLNTLAHYEHHAAQSSCSDSDVQKSGKATIKEQEKQPQNCLERNKMGIDDLLAELSRAPPVKEWEIDIYELRFIKRIGQGSAGTTYLADWAGQEVAVKVASITELGLEGWRTEVQALQKLHHPNIIRLLGSVYHPHPLTFCLVLEYCTAGDLSTALSKPTPRNFFWHVSSSVAKGLHYLHSRGVIHRDIKPSNILLQGTISDGKYQVRVTDFGVATDCSTFCNRTAETGTYRWMAPEVIRHEKYSQTADVYSYAILLWQLLTREDPFCDISQIAAAAAVAMDHARPRMPEDTPVAISNFIRQLWDEDPNKRSSFLEIIENLKDLEQDVSFSVDDRQWLDFPLGHAVYRKMHQVSVSKSPKLPLTKPKPFLPHLSPGGPNKHIKDKKRIGIRSLFSRKSSHF